MLKDALRVLRACFRDQYGVVARPQLRAMGIDDQYERARVAAGEWDRPAPSVVRLTSSRQSPEQALMIALLRAGPAAVASHQSAAWLWNLAPAPTRHAVTVPRTANGKAAGADVHRRVEPLAQISWRGRFPCTDPLRTLVDLAAVVGPAQLDEAIDRALAKKLVTVEGLVAEIGRTAKAGRSGPSALRHALKRRGLIGAPHPSVLESKVLRLLASGGITPLRCEVRYGEDGRYYIDTELAHRVFMEVDGNRYHSTPEQKYADEKRRNEIRLAGNVLLVYDWLAVVRDGRRVLAECHQAIANRRRSFPPPARRDPSRSEGSPAQRRG